MLPDNRLAPERLAFAFVAALDKNTLQANASPAATWPSFLEALARVSEGLLDPHVSEDCNAVLLLTRIRSHPCLPPCRSSGWFIFNMVFVMG